MAGPSSYSVLGLDPGLNCTGYSLIQFGSGDYQLIDCGTLRTCSKDNLSFRLKKICSELRDILNGFQPDYAAIEETFVAQNARSALLLGHIRGALLLTISLCGIPAFEYSPREIKMSVVGYGAASKSQVKSMLCNIFRLNLERYSLDATDAIAVAICHIHTNGNRATVKET
ncbi:MAG: crossover junction endodeoxyribonuclease RuvC [bacterium]